MGKLVGWGDRVFDEGDGSCGCYCGAAEVCCVSVLFGLSEANSGKGGWEVAVALVGERFVEWGLLMGFCERGFYEFVEDLAS